MNFYELYCTISKSAIAPASRCDGAAVFIHFGIRDAASADHGLKHQSHAEFEANSEDRNLVGTVDLRCAVLELLKGFMLRLRQCLYAHIFVIRREMQ